MTGPCIHHWRINEEGTRGVCELCGIVRIYRPTSELSAQERREMYRKAREEINAASAVPGIAESGLVTGRSNRRVNSEARTASGIRASWWE
jgi:hypothetical protein